MRISKIYSNQNDLFEPIFFNIGSNKELEYSDLLNVVYAEIIRHKDEKVDSHNLGKSKLIDLIDFLFLKQIKDKQSHFLYINETLFNKFIFFIEIALNDGRFLTLKRSVEDHTKISFKIHVSAGQNYSDPDFDEWDKKNIAFSKAKLLLDSYLDLDAIKPWDYRQGITYFLRTQQDYNDWFKMFKFQGSDKDWKPYLANVFGMDGANIGQKYEIDKQIEEKEKNKKKIENKISYSEEEFNKLKTIVDLLNSDLTKLEMKLDSFSFKDEEKAINENLINNIEYDISTLNGEILNSEYECSKIEEALKTKISFNLNEIKKIYDDVNVLLPESLVKNYDELLIFNEKISTERSKVLSERAKELLNKIECAQHKKDNLDKQRSDALKILSDTNSFHKYKLLQKEFSKKQAELIKMADKLEQLDQVKKISKEIEELVEKRNKIVKLMIKEIDDSNIIAKQIKDDFNYLVKSVLNKNGVISLSINGKKNIDFDLNIFDDLSKKTSQSDGTSYKKLLCALFDLAVLRTYANDKFYHFVYHDGIFEGLDPRRKRSLLKIIKETCEQYKIQYILTVIDEDLPRNDEDKKELFDNSEVILKLNDTGESGRLFKMKEF